jgi:hypothetical protein
MSRILIAVALVAIGAFVPAPGSRAPAQPNANGAATCELHFWPSDRAVTSAYSGVGGAVGGLLSGPRQQTQAGLASDLPPAAQAEALARLDLSSLLGMPNVRVIAEPLPLAARANRRSPRLTGSTAPCYAELVVDFIGYSTHITAGRKFGARFWLRRYPDGSGLAQVQNGGKDVQLHVYPARRPEDQPAALAELSAAFGRAAERFLRDKVGPVAVGGAQAH